MLCPQPPPACFQFPLFRWDLGRGSQHVAGTWGSWGRYKHRPMARTQGGAPGLGVAGVSWDWGASGYGGGAPAGRGVGTWAEWERPRARVLQRAGHVLPIGEGSLRISLRANQPPAPVILHVSDPPNISTAGAMSGLN